MLKQEKKQTNRNKAKVSAPSGLEKGAKSSLFHGLQSPLKKPSLKELQKAKSRSTPDPKKNPNSNHNKDKLTKPLEDILGDPHAPMDPLAPLSNGSIDGTKEAYLLAAQTFKHLEAYSPFAGIDQTIKRYEHFYADMAEGPSAISESILLGLKHLFDDAGHLMRASQNYATDLSLLMQSTVMANPNKKSMGSQIIAEGPRDKRFRNSAWKELPYFSYLRQSYLLWRRFMKDVFYNIDGLTENERNRVNFYINQLCDALSPSNIPWMNPDSLERTFLTGGENIFKGLENLYRDFEKGQGRLDISMVDLDAFKLGENIASTPGKVIFQNDLVQLIQYAASTDKVYEIPILIVPPCINKFYIFDLRPENSFVKWLCDQGYTVFIISWVNPTRKLAQKTFENYVLEGVLESAKVINKICKTQELNALGFCIGGNILAVANAYAAKSGARNPFKTATYLATLFDFSKAGDLKIFFDDQSLKILEKSIYDNGFMDGNILKRTFNVLRANDLIWSFVINNYFLGEQPTAFDFLYWNADSTNLPARMYTYFLRNFFIENQLIKPNALSIAGIPIDLGQITNPSFFLSAIEDHIAPWQSTFAGLHKFGSLEKRFLLAGSGHVAGIFNPPSKNKYSYFQGNTALTNPEMWLDKATEEVGSWWQTWCKWTKDYAGAMINAREIGSNHYKPLQEAPGAYVLQKNDASQEQG